MHKPLDHILSSDLASVGGKAYNCARLRQAGFPVPDGLAIGADATAEEIHSLTDDSWLAAQPADAQFAVRSSGIGEDSSGHSFAGIHETYLNVGRDRIVEHVLRCRDSGRSAQAAAYRAARGVEGDDNGPAIGVLVQRMVAAETSGVAFTVNPVTGADEIVINAASGLGEALVSGLVTPDEFTVEKRDGRILSAHRADGANAPGPSSLADAQVQALAVLLVSIEQHYGAAQDIEWCHDGRQFWIVQSRPVTTAPHVIGLPARPDTEWTRANLVEVFPEQLSRQCLVAYDDMLNRGQRKFMGRLLAQEDELGPIFGVFLGRMYMNLSQMRRVVGIIGAPVADMLRSLGHADAIHPDDEIGKRPPLRALLPCLPDFFRIVRRDLTAGRVMRRHEQNTRETIAQLTAVNPASLSDQDIWKTLMWWSDLAPDAIQIVFVMSGVLSRETFLRKACRTVDFPYERLVYTQLAAGERSVSTKQAVALVALTEVARAEPAAREYLLGNDGTFTDFRTRLAGTSFLARLDRFLDEYGHRGRYESDWALPRLHENPAAALFAIQQHLHSPPVDLEAVAGRQQADAAAAWREFEARLTAWQRWTLLPRVRSTLRELKQRYVWREQVRSDLTRIVRYIREYHLTLAGRFVERGWLLQRDDYFLLTFDEIGPAIGDPQRGPGLRAIAEQRAKERAAERDLKLPALMRERDLARLLQAPAASTTGMDTLAGLCVSPGRVEGEVVVILDPAHFASMKRGAILVAPATDPSWTPLFTLASGVIVEIGGMLSHASTIAREYGLPALANVKHATRALRTGDRVLLDATGGSVTRIVSASAPETDQSSAH